jgi:hypothetical protein
VLASPARLAAFRAPIPHIPTITHMQSSWRPAAAASSPRRRLLAARQHCRTPVFTHACLRTLLLAPATWPWGKSRCISSAHSLCQAPRSSHLLLVSSIDRLIHYVVLRFFTLPLLATRSQISHPFAGSIFDPGSACLLGAQPEGLSCNSIAGYFMVYFANVTSEMLKSNEPGIFQLVLHPNGVKVFGGPDISLKLGEEHRRLRTSFLPLFTRKALCTYLTVQD